MPLLDFWSQPEASGNDRRLALRELAWVGNVSRVRSVALVTIPGKKVTLGDRPIRYI
jgi:hypothetical protein